MLEKPKTGQPCNRCGLCCTIEPCKLAREFLHCTIGPCVALEADKDDRKTCGLLTRPAWYMLGEVAPECETGRLSVLLAYAIGVGRGCDSSD